MDFESPNGWQVGLNPKVKNTTYILSAYDCNPKEKCSEELS